MAKPKIPPPDTYATRRVLVDGLLESARRAERWQKEVARHWPDPVPSDCRCCGLGGSEAP